SMPVMASLISTPCSPATNSSTRRWNIAASTSICRIALLRMVFSCWYTLILWTAKNRLIEIMPINKIVSGIQYHFQDFPVACIIVHLPKKVFTAELQRHREEYTKMQKEEGAGFIKEFCRLFCEWRARRDSNSRHPGSKPGTLSS